jgi:hypothetical protein
MTALQEHLTQLTVVVDLAVEDDPDGPILVADWLLAALEVDDAQPSHAESNTWTEIHAFLVRAPVHQQSAHRADFLFQDRFAVKANDSSNTAHD